MSDAVLRSDVVLGDTILSPTGWTCSSITVVVTGFFSTLGCCSRICINNDIFCSSPSSIGIKTLDNLFLYGMRDKRFF